MTLAGWIIMICSIAVVLGLMIFCFCRVLTKPASANHMHAPLDIDTKDRDT